MMLAAARRLLLSAEPSFEIPSVSGRDSARQICLPHRAGPAGAGADVDGCDGGGAGGGDGANDDSAVVAVYL